MNTYILILTLLAQGGNDGQGGLATAEFNDKTSCELAGEIWKSKLPSGNWGVMNNGSFYICVSKNTKEK